MNVLVTGSTGFIGSALCKALLAQGQRVRAFHRPTSNLLLLEGLPVEHSLGSLAQPATLQEAMQGIEVVFHTAALMGGASEPGQLYMVTVEGTRAVLQAARQAGVRRLVHTSSVAALGVPEWAPMHKAAPGLIDERHTWNYPAERWPYGYAKYLAELEVQAVVAQGLDAVIVNPSLVMGAGDIYRQSSSLVVQVARQRLPALVEGGLNVVHLADVVAGHLAALEHGKTGERYILGGENLSIVELVRKIAAIVGAAAPSLVLPAGIARLLALPLGWASPFVDFPTSSELLNLAGSYFYFSTRKAQSQLGLEPPRSAEEAIAEAYRWFQAARVLPDS
jgi:dihydroflavonol-4-reductase